MKISDEKKGIAKAMNLLQKQLRSAHKDSTNPHFKSRYSSIESTWDALRDPLTDNGLSCEQEVTTGEKSVSVLTFIFHESGEWMELGPLTMPVTKLDCQGFASAISYALRYALKAAFGIVSGDDDDGNLAAQPAKPQTVTHHAIDKKEVIKISVDQVMTIKKMLSSINKDVANNFIASLRPEPVCANTIEEIPAAHYDGIVKYLQSQVASKPNE